MSLTVSRGEETIVITITSNPKSKWPALCQILGSLFNGPECSASEDMKEKLTETQKIGKDRQNWKRHTDTQKIGGIVPTVVAVMIMGCIGLIFFIADPLVTSMVLWVPQYCVVIIFFILTIKSLSKKSGSAKLVDKTTSVSRSGIRQYLLMFSSWFSRSCSSMTLASPEDMKDKLTEVDTALGTVQIMIGVMNIAMGCFGFIFSFWIGAVFILVGIMCVVAVTVSHPKLLVIAVILNVVSAALAITAAVLYSMDLAMGSSLSCYKEQYYHSIYYDWQTHKKSSFQSCFFYKNLNQVILGGLDIMMAALSVLQLCVSISFCVLTGKALLKSVEDPELLEPLLEDATAGDA